jgi:tetratricopeptide (TPR) repeat protein
MARRSVTAADQCDPLTAAGCLGEMWLQRCNYDRALEAYTRLTSLQPANAQGYFGRGMVHEQRGDLDEADADYTEAIRLQPESGGAYALRARVRHGQGRKEEALADLSQHLRQHPNDALACHFRAFLHKERNALPEQLADLNDAHRAAPDNPMFQNALAWMLATCSEARLRDGPRALTLARSACEATDWNNSYCLDTLAAACAETGAFAEAVRWETQAIDLGPSELNSARRERLERYRACESYRE